MNTTTSSDDHTTVALTLQLPAKVVGALRDIVAAKNVHIDTLVSGYISGGIEHDQQQVHRKCFLTHVKEVLEKHNVPSEAIAEIDDKFAY